jgi:hypothetical protein
MRTVGEQRAHDRGREVSAEAEREREVEQGQAAGVAELTRGQVDDRQSWTALLKRTREDRRSRLALAAGDAERAAG